MGKFDIDLSPNPIKPKNLKQYAQMKIEEKRKKQQDYEDKQKALRGEPIDVLHGKPAVVRGYKDLNVKRFFNDGQGAYEEHEKKTNQVENALSNARYIAENENHYATKVNDEKYKLTSNYKPDASDAVATLKLKNNRIGKEFYFGDDKNNSGAHEAGHVAANNYESYGNNFTGWHRTLKELNEDRINIDKDATEHDLKLKEYQADRFSVLNGMLNAGIWDGKSKINDNQINQYRNMLIKQHKSQDKYKYKLGYIQFLNQNYNNTKREKERKELNKLLNEAKENYKNEKSKYYKDEIKFYEDKLNDIDSYYDKNMAEVRKRSKESVLDPYDLGEMNLADSRFFYTTKKKNYKKALNSFADEGVWNDR